MTDGALDRRRLDEAAPAAGSVGTDGSRRFAGWLSVPFLILWIGSAAIAIPTIIAVYQQNWSTEQGAQGPLVLAMGLWLFVRDRPGARRAGRQPSVARLSVALLAGAFLYLLGRISDQYTLESYGCYAIGVAVVYGFVGGRGLAAIWFPVAYLIAALPVPYSINLLLTSHLRLLVTQVAVAATQASGLPVARDGLNILLDHYSLAVQDACSGMNSLFSLTAIGLMYLYLRRRGPWPYLLAMVPPIAVMAVIGNIVRVLVLIGLTHFFGDAVAQGFLHEGAGLATFAATMLLLIGLDALLWPVVAGSRKVAG